MYSLYVSLTDLNSLSSDGIQYISLAIAFLAVFFSPLISYLTTKLTINSQLKLSNQQINTQIKIAERNLKSEVLSRNRQNWINTLRDNISEFISLSIVITKITSVHKDYDDKMEKFLTLRSRISLLLNPKEDDHNKLDKYLKEALYFVIEKEEQRHIVDIRNDIIKLSQEILKREWERVKQVE
jgi:hypothetical protein